VQRFLNLERMPKPKPQARRAWAFSSLQATENTWYLQLLSHLCSNSSMQLAIQSCLWRSDDAWSYHCPCFLLWNNLKHIRHTLQLISNWSTPQMSSAISPIASLWTLPTCQFTKHSWTNGDRIACLACRDPYAMRLFFTTDWYTKSLDLAQAPLAFPLDSTFLLNLAYSY
jgi:hypothetical protein